MNITTIFFDNDWGLVLEYMLEFETEIVFVRKKMMILVFQLN